MLKHNSIIIGILVLINFQVIADDNDNTKSHSKDNHNIHSHHCASFLGFTSNPDAGHTDFTLGIDYEYRLSFIHHIFGAGFVTEIVFADHQETIAAASLYFHPYGDFKFNVSAGYAFAEEKNEETHESETEKHFLTRIGIVYDFHISGFSVGPVFNLDFMNDHTYKVYGISIGKGF